MGLGGAKTLFLSVETGLDLEMIFILIKKILRFTTQTSPPPNSSSAEESQVSLLPYSYS